MKSSTHVMSQKNIKMKFSIQANVSVLKTNLLLKFYSHLKKNKNCERMVLRKLVLCIF
jgi:hypothetical protein